jgi:hypothetical protein
MKIWRAGLNVSIWIWAPVGYGVLLRVRRLIGRNRIVRYTRRRNVALWLLDVVLLNLICIVKWVVGLGWVRSWTRLLRLGSSIYIESSIDTVLAVTG